MAEGRVDPGALLIAVFAVGVGPHLEAGPWTVNNTIIATIVLLVVLFYLAPQPGISRPHLAAVCLVVSFILGVVLAWPVQWMLEQAGRDIATAETYATNIGLAVTLLAAPLYAVLWWHLRKEPAKSGAGAQSQA
jgi:hypothetical protein